MSVEAVKGNDYEISYNDGMNKVSFSGSLRLRDTKEYQPISNLLSKAYANLEDSDTLLLDFGDLKFLNSSGINTISRFVISARKINKGKLYVKGNPAIFWQKKSLKNLSMLWPKIDVQIG